jgi:glycerophosphoryl diester phosphodiesterase
VFEAFPGRKFLINYKSRRAEEGTALAALLGTRGEFRASIFGVYGGFEPTRAAIAAIPGLRGYDRQSLKACIIRYIALGWSGYVPDACRNTIVALPVNIARWMWGWPHRFTSRMQAAGTDVRERFFRGAVRRHHHRLRRDIGGGVRRGNALRA